MSEFEPVKRSQLEEGLWLMVGHNPRSNSQLEAARVLHESLGTRDAVARAELEYALLKVLTDGPNKEAKVKAALLLHESISVREKAE